MQTCCRNTAARATARLYFDNPALVLIISQPLFPMGNSPAFTGFLACQRNHQAESILTCARSPGYAQVYRFADNKRAHGAINKLITFLIRVTPRSLILSIVDYCQERRRSARPT